MAEAVTEHTSTAMTKSVIILLSFPMRAMLGRSRTFSPDHRKNSLGTEITLPKASPLSSSFVFMVLQKKSQGPEVSQQSKFDQAS